VYPPEFQVWNVLSTAGATILGIGYLLPMVYLTWAWFRGQPAGDNPWDAKGLEWETTSPPPTFNFDRTPVVTEATHAYGHREEVNVV
jgi:cytochrome c oxidase subunit 1